MGRQETIIGHEDVNLDVEDATLKLMQKILSYGIISSAFGVMFTHYSKTIRLSSRTLVLRARPTLTHADVYGMDYTALLKSIPACVRILTR